MRLGPRLCRREVCADANWVPSEPRQHTPPYTTLEDKPARSWTLCAHAAGGLQFVCPALGPFLCLTFWAKRGCTGQRYDPGTRASALGPVSWLRVPIYIVPESIKIDRPFQLEPHSTSSHLLIVIQSVHIHPIFLYTFINKTSYICYTVYSISTKPPQPSSFIPLYHLSLQQLHTNRHHVLHQCLCCFGDCHDSR